MSGDDGIERAFFRIARPVDGVDGHEAQDSSVFLGS